MAAPMTPAEPTRDAAIKAKENAIKSRLSRLNTTNKLAAQKVVNKQRSTYAKNKPAKGKTFMKQYNTQAIKGAKEGFTPSDYGVGAGAAIPYQIGESKATASATYTPEKRPGRPSTTTRRVAIENRLLDKAKVKGG
jgi:hypothetical protein